MIEYTTLGNLIAPAKVIRCGKGSFPVLSMTMHDGIVLQSERFKKSLASIDQSDYKVVKRGQLVVGFPIDEGVLYVQKAADEGIMSPAYNVWDIDTEKVDADFLELCLHSPQSMQYYKNKLRGTTARRRSIPTADLLALKIRLPDMQMQREAVAIIRKAEAVIKARQAQLDFFEQLVKSRFIELFESKPWETVRAGTIMFDMRNGVSPSNTGTYPTKVLTLSAITQGDFDPEAWKDGMFDTVPPIEKRVSASDFYMCRGNGNKNLVGAGVYSKEDRYDLVFPDTAIAATVDLQRVCLPYLFHAWKQPSVREQIEMGARTTNGTYKINQGVVSNIELILPPLDLQKQFAAFVEQTDKSKLCGEMEVAA